ncbi:hypothetical protein, partial [Burkholderia multivorans]|uniref:hypothetical protein n=1 Tax=Burkholderia multivorans TaxID=87883 RepID=UPI001E613A38
SSRIQDSVSSSDQHNSGPVWVGITFSFCRRDFSTPGNRVIGRGVPCRSARCFDLGQILFEGCFLHSPTLRSYFISVRPVAAREFPRNHEELHIFRLRVCG